MFCDWAQIRGIMHFITQGLINNSLREICRLLYHRYHHRSNQWYWFTFEYHANITIPYNILLSSNLNCNKQNEKKIVRSAQKHGILLGNQPDSTVVECSPIKLYVVGLNPVKTTEFSVTHRIGIHSCCLSTLGHNKRRQSHTGLLSP